MQVAAAQSGLRGGLLLLLAAAAALTLWAVRRSMDRAAGPETFLGHVEELRRRLLVWLTVMLAGTALAFGVRVEPTAAFWRPVPALADNVAAQVFRLLAERLVPERVRLVATSPLDGFMAEFAVALGIGFALSLPVLLVQGARFFGPALRPQERRVLQWAFVPSMALFALGVAFGYVLVLPFLFDTLYTYSDALGAEPLLALPDFMTFTIGLLLALGLAFQLPVVMVALTRVGLVASRTWLAKWRHALIGILVVSALVTDPTVISQLMVAAPMLALYFLGVLVAVLVERRAK